MSGVYVTKQDWNGIVSVRIRFLIAQISSRADTRGGANNPKGLSFLLRGVALDLSEDNRLLFFWFKRSYTVHE